jgi:hypothetical protein
MSIQKSKRESKADCAACVPSWLDHGCPEFNTPCCNKVFHYSCLNNFLRKQFETTPAQASEFKCICGKTFAPVQCLDKMVVVHPICGHVNFQYKGDTNMYYVVGWGMAVGDLEQQSNERIGAEYDRIRLAMDPKQDIRTRSVDDVVRDRSALVLARPGQLPCLRCHPVPGYKINNSSKEHTSSHLKWRIVLIKSHFLNKRLDHNTENYCRVFVLPRCPLLTGPGEGDRAAGAAAIVWRAEGARTGLGAVVRLGIGAGDTALLLCVLVGTGDGRVGTGDGRVGTGDGRVGTGTVRVGTGTGDGLVGFRVGTGDILIATGDMLAGIGDILVRSALAGDIAARPYATDGVGELDVFAVAFGAGDGDMRTGECADCVDRTMTAGAAGAARAADAARARSVSSTLGGISSGFNCLTNLCDVGKSDMRTTRGADGTACTGPLLCVRGSVARDPLSFGPLDEDWRLDRWRWRRPEREEEDEDDWEDVWTE